MTQKYTKTKIALMVGSLLAPSITIAQENLDQTTQADQETELITVTGSRIKRKDHASPSPLVTTSAAEIVDSGRVAMDDYLKDLPQFSPGTGDYSNDTNGGTAGRATLNLRNLGSKRNLVIMDGRRLVSSGIDGAIDINTIPSLAIESVETISGGASVTYGSDALSGVVNFMTRRNLDGFEFSAQHNVLDDDGDSSSKMGFAYGSDYDDGRGYLLLSAEYLDRGAVGYSERDFFNINPQASSFTVYGRSRVGPSWLSVDNDGTVFLTDRGTPYGNDPANVFGDPVELPLMINDDGGITTHGQFDSLLQVPLEQTNLFAKTEYEFDNGILGYAQGLYASSTSSNVGAQPNSAGVWGVTIPGDNYYIHQVPDLADALGGNGISTFQTRIMQAGPRKYETDNTVFQIVAGLAGDFGDLDMSWDVHMSYGQTDTEDSTKSGAVNFIALQEIIDTTDPSTGVTPLCAGGYNPFGGTTPLSESCLDYISRTPVNETQLKQFVLEATVEGLLAELPAGEARYALTAHYRDNDFEYNPDADIAAGQLANLSSSQHTTGNIRAKEIGGEVYLPLYTDDTGVQSLNVTLGARASNYEQTGTDLTYKAEFDAQLTENLMVRGSYQHAFRAPNIQEFFSPDLLRVNPFDDVCSASYRGDRVDPAAEAALCAEQGAASNYRQSGSSAPTITTGNLDLKPEEADTYTLGAVVDFEVGEAEIQISADYYNIEIEDAIEVLSAADVFIKCFNLDGTSNPSYDNDYIACQQINRPSGVDLDPVNQPILNLGGIKTSGFDIMANINWNNFRFSSAINILNSYEVQAFVDEQFVEYKGTVSTDTASPEFKMVNSISYNWDDTINVMATWRHIASMDDRSTARNSESTIEGAPSYNYFDLKVNYNFNEDLSLYAGVNNLNDETPPQIGGSTDDGEFSATNRGVYDIIGRHFHFGLKAKF